MPLSRFAFIVKAPGYSPNEHAVEISSEQFSTQVIGVSSLASAIQVAHQLVASGVQLIELCGGFSEDDAEQLRVHIERKIPVGVVAYSKEQAEELERIFK
ncbi:MAG: DUF6506 family protein [Inhella sp.]|uniref:DUF6506 family protein n=1 Tax=Inhella sp. TaxID=1921806 RepID=UPI003919859E